MEWFTSDFGFEGLEDRPIVTSEATRRFKELAPILPDDEPTIPIKWRAGVPDGRSAGSLSQFIREYLCRHGGRCSRDELLHAIRAEPDLRAKLERGQGFARLLQNMRHSGFVSIDGETVRATAKALRRTLNSKRS